MAPGRLDAGHLDLEFAHRFIPAEGRQGEIRMTRAGGRMASEVTAVK
jgi:hypothetical protein